MIGRDSDIAGLLRRAAKTWVTDPEEGNVIDAARALERALQTVLQSFQTHALGKHGHINQPPEKAFNELSLGDLIQAVYGETRGDEPVVPIEFVAAELDRADSEKMWTSKGAIEELKKSVRVKLAHSKIDPANPESIDEADRHDKFKLIEFTAGFAYELGIINRGDIDDLQDILRRDFEKFPELDTRPTKGENSLPPRPYAAFIGRQDELHQLVDHVEGSQSPISIEGEGGFGKTALAWRLCDKIRGRGTFSALAWISGKRRSLEATGIEEHSGYIQGEKTLFKQLCEIWHIQRSSDLDVLKEDLSSFLRGNRALIVIDNWEDLPDAARRGVRWLKEQANVVVTSRPEVGFLDNVKLDPLSRKHIIALMRSEYGKKIGGKLNIKEEHAERIYEATGGNPLGAWWLIEKIRIGGSLQGSLEELEQEAHDFLEYCYKNLLETIGGEAERVARILVASDDTLTLRDLGQLVDSQEEARKGLRELQGLNLIIGKGEGSGFDLTPLCHRYLRKSWEGDPKQQLANETWLEYVKNLDAFEQSLRLGPYNSPAHSYYEKFKERGDIGPLQRYHRENEFDVWAKYFLAIAYRKQGDPPKGIQLLKQARRQVLDLPGGDEFRDYPQILRELAYAHRDASNYREAAAVAAEAYARSEDYYMQGLYGELLCKNQELDEGIPLLIDLVTEKREYLTRENLRYWSYVICDQAVYYPSEGGEEERVRMLKRALAAVRQYKDLLSSIDDREALVQLHYAVIRERKFVEDPDVLTKSEIETIAEETKNLAYPGSEVRIPKRGGGYRIESANRALENLRKDLELDLGG